MAATASAIRYAPEDPNLPKPWKGLVNSRTGYLYFWSPETNVTQYERPASSAPPKLAAIPISSSVQTTQQSSSGFNSGKEEDKYSRGSDGPKSDSGSRFNEGMLHLVDHLPEGLLLQPQEMNCPQRPIAANMKLPSV
ncbi:unnamed protein product [Arabidopsis halleri]